MKGFVALAPLAALAACASNAGGTASGKQAITPPGMEWARDRFHYSPAVRYDGLVHVAAVQATIEPGEEGRAGQEAAFDRAFREIGAVLEASGSSWADVLDMTTYHTDLRGQIDAFMAVKDRFVTEPYPAWTAVDIDRLYSDNAVAEIKIVARARPAAN